MNHCIQTFPPDFIFTGSKTDQEQMIGNAVPVNLAKFVGIAIQDFLSQDNDVGSLSQLSSLSSPKRKSPVFSDEG